MSTTQSRLRALAVRLEDGPHSEVISAHELTKRYGATLALRLLPSHPTAGRAELHLARPGGRAPPHGPRRRRAVPVGGLVPPQPFKGLAAAIVFALAATGVLRALALLKRRDLIGQ